MSDAAQQLQPFVTAIDHVGVAVADLDAAIDFYTETFGLVHTHTENNDEQGVREAMLHVPADEGTGTAIQLLAPLRPDSAIGKFLDKQGPGLQQLAYRVSDIAKAAQSLRGRELRLLWEQPKRGTAGSKVNFVHPKDAGGVLVELVEPATEH